MSQVMKVVKTIEVEGPGLGEKIKQLRQADGRSLKSICKSVGMTPMNWHRIENEKQTLPLETLRRIESVFTIDLGISIDAA